MYIIILYVHVHNCDNSECYYMYILTYNIINKMMYLSYLVIKMSYFIYSKSTMSY